jgi:hypothetical protein
LQACWEFLSWNFQWIRDALFEISTRVFQIDVIHQESFQNMSTIFELCRWLIETNKSQHYRFIDKLIHLILTLLVFTITTKQAFSAIKNVKIMFRNKIKEKFLISKFYDDLHWREIAKDINSDSIIDEFYFTKHWRVKLR